MSLNTRREQKKHYFVHMKVKTTNRQQRKKCIPFTQNKLRHENQPRKGANTEYEKNSLFRIYRFILHIYLVRSDKAQR